MAIARSFEAFKNFRKFNPKLVCDCFKVTEWGQGGTG